MDLVERFKEFKCNVEVYDPWIDKNKEINKYNIRLIDNPNKDVYDVIILAVAHDVFKKLTLKEIKAFGKNKHVLYDIKYLFNKDEVDGRL